MLKGRFMTVGKSFFKIGFIVLIACSFLFYTFNLGEEPFQDYDEATYAQVVTETTQTNDLQTLRLLNAPWFEKPPLYFWMAMVTEKIFSDVEFAYRFPSAVSGTLSVIFIVLIALALTKNYTVGLLSGAILLFFAPFLEATRQLRLDVPVTAAILFGVYAFLKSLEKPVWALGVGIAVAIAVLMKSVIGLLIGPVIFLWAFVNWKFNWLKNPYLWFGGLIGILMLVPWHLHEHLQYGAQFWNSYLGTHVIDRFDSNLLQGASTGSNQTYIAYLFQFALPWTVIFILLLPVFLYKKKYSLEEYRHQLFPALTVVFITTLFFIAGTKIAYYLIPLYPFISLFIATAFHYITEKNISSLKTVAVGTLLVSFIIAGANIYFVGSHTQKDLKINVVIAEAEQEIGSVIREQDPTLTVYTYEYYYWETLRYYSGGRRIELIKEDDALDRPFLLVMRTQLYNADPFPPELAAQFEQLFQNEVLTLLKFTPPRT